MGLAIAFWILAIVVVLAGMGVIVLRNVFRAALALVVCLSAIAGLFITLSADFLAAIQILVYVGAISVLIILAIMLTQNVQQGNSANRLRLPAFIIAAAFFGLMAFAVLNTNWQIATAEPLSPTTAALAEKIFAPGGFILPLEIVPVLILAVILGAIVLVREK
jgi:NADH:ubiquinone oxidoreductase subunit 6 (subunit J)